MVVPLPMVQVAAYLAAAAAVVVVGVVVGCPLLLTGASSG